MDNLTGVSMYVKNISSLAIGSILNIHVRSYNSRQPLPVQRIEFLKEVSGNLRYIIAALPHGYSAKFFHRSTCPAV